tara:strand:- start:280 stop:546 length:267 start_codon:yes stop_codon:yes gene_type:complete
MLIYETRENAPNCLQFQSLSGRGDRIRTCDLCDPNAKKKKRSNAQPLPFTGLTVFLGLFNRSRKSLDSAISGIIRAYKQHMSGGDIDE